MNQVNATEIQEHLSDFLDSLTQGETSIIIEKAQKSLKQLDIYLISEDDEESFSPEEVIKAYNQLHGTEFTVENIVNSRGGDSNFSSW
jgi:hypothetical protein